MGSLTLSLYFGAGILGGTIISLLLVRKTALYTNVWNQLKSKHYWMDQLKWVILALFVTAVFVGFSSLLNPSDEIFRFILGLSVGLMMALLPVKKA